MANKRFILIHFCLLSFCFVAQSQSLAELEAQVSQSYEEYGEYSEQYSRSLIEFTNYALNYEPLDTNMIVNNLEQICKIHKTLYGVADKRYNAYLLYKGLFYADIKEYRLAIDDIVKAINQESSFYNDEVAIKLGGCYTAIGDYSKALNCYIEYKDFIKSQLGENDSMYAIALQKVGVAYDNLGMIQEELECFKEAEEILSKSYYWKNTLEYAEVLRNLALTLFDLNLMDEALDCHLRAVDVYSKREDFEERQWYTARAYRDIGLLYIYCTKFDSALEYTLKSKRIFEELGLLQSSEYGGTIGNLGIIYNELGRYEEALDCHLKGLNITKINGESKSLQYATALDNIGISYYNLGQLDEALSYCRSSYNMVVDIQGEGMRSIPPLGNICIILNEMGKYNETLVDLYRMLSILSHSTGENTSLYAQTLADIANVHFQNNQIDSAKVYNSKSRQVYESLDYMNEQYLYALTQKVGLSITEEDYDEAICEMTHIEKLKRDYVVEHIFNMTSQDREDFWLTNQQFYFQGCPLISYYTANNPQSAKLLYNVALFSKGLLLNTEMELRDFFATSDESADLELYEEYCSLDNLISTERQKNPNQRNPEFNLWVETHDSIERTLMRRYKELENYKNSFNVTWEDVQHKLGKHDVAIEFVEVPISTDTTMYCALVLKNNKGPRLVEICSLSEIHSLFNQVENETRNNMNSSNVKYVHLSENGSICKHYTADGLIYSGSELYELIWEPLESEIKNAKRIWFSPAGELYQIAIEYAETGTGAFNERKEVHRVSSTRQLLQSNLTHINKAVLFGGLDYDCLIEDSKAASPKGHMNKDVSGVVEAFKTRGGERFPYLRSTEDEIIYISTCLNTKGISTDLYVGDTGTEDTFKKVEKNNYKVIHLATHGFFWNERQVDYYGARLGWQSLQQNNGASQLEDVSMSRSGLVFSGVNSTISDDVNYVEPENDGILTAREISQLHLYGVDLVTLSACQTGLGEVTGDGVMGLQRGFKKAGVQSIIMSLWEVDDSATQILMTSFYKHLMQGKNKHIALRLAQHELKKIPEYNCPYYWASFILLD